VVSLATWAPRRQPGDDQSASRPGDQPLAAWLAGELAERYRLPAAAARAWASQDDLVLLLDGLDEVADRYRNGCAEAINRFLHDRPFTRVAVCCRADTVAGLSSELALPQTLELRPAGTAQVDAYLARLETTWTPLADIRTALAADERLRVPLMLKVAALANRGRTPPARHQQDRAGRRLRAPEWPREIAEIFAPQPFQHALASGPGQRGLLDQATIWEAYVTRMLSQRSLASGRDYDEATARQWLTWLAARLRDSGDTEFQLDYLAPDREAQAHHRSGTRFAEWRRVLRHVTVWTDRNVQTGALDLARWLESRESGGQAGRRTASWLRDHAARARPGAWLRRLPTAMTKPAEEASWSPERVPSPAPPLIGVLALPAVTAIVATVAGWPLALLAALACGLLQGLNLPRRLGMVPRPRRPKTTPNESIRRSARQAAISGIATAAGFGIGLELVCHVLTSTVPGAPVIALAAIIAGAAASLSNGAGACARHYLARFRLARAGVIPWRYQTFLDAMTERTLLHRSASGYLFIHRLLGEHLSYQVNPAGNIANTPPALANTEVIPVALSHEPAYRADQPPSQRVSHRAQQPAGRHSAGAG
jgi:hypothetical protein